MSCFLLSFAVDDRQSFVDATTTWLQRVRAQGRADAKIMLVGTKADLPEAQREVSIEDAQMAAGRMRCRYFETSSKNDLNIEQIFSYAASLGIEVALNDVPPRVIPFEGTVPLHESRSPSFWSRLASLFSSLFK